MRDKIVRNINKLPICGIYQITNKVNGKIYVGQSIDIERRWNQHRYGKGSIILRNAILKYGINNFNFEILEEVEYTNKNDVVEKLSELEDKWLISKKPYLKENGYNQNKISKINIPITRPDGYGELISKIKIDNNHCGKLLKQYSLSGDFIMGWKSAAQVERKLGFKAENISACCLGKQKTCNNFIWKFSDFKLNEELVIELNKKLRAYKPVIMLSMDGVKIMEFDSLKLASEYVNCPSYQISKVCNGQQKSCRGYIWKFL